jgi:hypothetical protein
LLVLINNTGFPEVQSLVTEEYTKGSEKVPACIKQAGKYLARMDLSKSWASHCENVPNDDDNVASEIAVEDQATKSKQVHKFFDFNP